MTDTIINTFDLTQEVTIPTWINDSPNVYIHKLGQHW